MLIKCKQCVFFQYESMGQTAYGYGKCLRYAPRPTTVQDLIRPRVLDLDMCGDGVKADAEARQLTAEEMAEVAAMVQHPEAPKKMNDLIDKQREEKIKKAQAEAVKGRAEDIEKRKDW